ncbi:hypothetical protein ACRTDM_05480 [Shewanella algae]|uniref:hypothetical protein n=1 Tax=Shewanella algae TaxID=38313 RepID=UPI000D1354EF|nr:hypothetical protein [Shewanella algae]PSS68064.1 hypothetical protein AYI85_15730 [Shewanella algae]TVK96893.1 hypothetical protein AYI84_21500 [Shewanella algae]TVL52310.1 hypothetical protein AYI99_14870 [Shewanella algae]
MAKPGDELEKIVELIERSISPSSVIRQNVLLPVLNSPTGRTRQCDVVIESGPEFRCNLTIVEVQDRKSPVNIATFNDWLTKLDDVGANSLICISRKEFPESIKEVARFQGNRVLLVNLKEETPDTLPLNFLSFYVAYENVSITGIDALSCCVEKGSADLALLDSQIMHSNEKIWSTDKVSNMSIVELLSPLIKELHYDAKGIVKDVASFTFQNDRRLVLYCNMNGEYIRVGLNVVVQYAYDNHLLPMTVSSYEQIDHGVLAWVFEIDHETSHGKIKTKVPVIKHGDNAYEMLDVINSTDFNSQVTIRSLEQKPVV